MHLVTTLGPMPADRLGAILPHEHVFVDLRKPGTPGQGEAAITDVIRLMAPALEQAAAAGITAIVECSPEGVGRRADILRAVSGAANFPLVAPTGIYREPWVPRWAYDASEAELTDWMAGELEDEIAGSGVRAGFVKLSAGDDGLTASETRILCAAARAARGTHSAIGSHTIRGRVVRDQLDLIEACYISWQSVWLAYWPKHAKVSYRCSLCLTVSFEDDHTSAPPRQCKSMRQSHDAGTNYRIVIFMSHPQLPSVCKPAAG